MLPRQHSSELIIRKLRDIEVCQGEMRESPKSLQLRGRSGYRISIPHGIRYRTLEPSMVPIVT